MATKKVKRADDHPSVQLRNNKEEFRLNVQHVLIENRDAFIRSMNELKPRDFCEVYLKLLPYGFSRVPEDRTIVAESDQKLIAIHEKEKEILSIIQGGIDNELDDIEIEEV